MDYLYPGGAQTIDKPGIPHLTLPISVGIAFVPDAKGRYCPDIPEARKIELLRTVADRFSGQDFIQNIEIIPSTYLKCGGGFENLAQVGNMLGVDVVALVAYDQVQHTDQGLLSFSYLTVIGAFVINGEKNDTSTMLETSVFDVASRKLLFRVPGSSSVKAKAAYVNLSEQLRKDSLEGMNLANAEMITNLDAELLRFRQRVKEKPEQYQISRSPGYRGAGNLGGVFGGLVALLLVVGSRRRSMGAA